MRSQKLLTLALLTILSLTWLTVLSPQLKASLNGDNFIEQVTTAPSDIDVVDVDSQGRLFVIAENDIWRSIDQGATWTKVKDNPAPSGFALCIFIDSNDYVFCVPETASHNYVIQRSVDNGDTWTDELNEVPKLWEMDAMSNGTLLVNTYTTGSNWIYQSDDNGDNWSVFYNFTANNWNIDHIHAVGINDYNDDIYIVTGDGQYKSGVWRWNTTASQWDEIANSSTVAVEWQFTKIMFDSSYVYFLADGNTMSYKMLHNGTSQNDFTLIHDGAIGRVNTNFVFSDLVLETEGIYLFGTDEGQIWASWDGDHWVKIHDLGDNVCFRQFTNRKPIFLSESANGKLYRVDIQKEDIIQLYYAQHNQYRGSLTNAETYILEQRVWNGSTNYIDLTKVALTNVQASIKGLSKYNYAPDGNSGFEWNNKTGWSEAGSPNGATTSEEKANGTYSYKVIKASSDSYVSTLYTNSYINGSLGDIYVLSFYWKGNISASSGIEAYWENGTGSVRKHFHIDSTTSWQRYTFLYCLDSASSSGDWRIKFEKVTLTSYLDSVVMYKLEVGSTRGAVNSESIQNFEGYADVVGHKDQSNSNNGFNPTAYHDGELLTTNATLTINGEEVSHSGTLANGSESSTTSLTGILTGAVQVSANIGGSGQAILKINGTRLFNHDSVVLRERASNVYVGRFYGDLSITASMSDLIAVTNLASNITSVSFGLTDELTMVIDCPSFATSTTKVWCGEKGQPVEVYGADSWTYDNNICTITREHASSQQVVVSWMVQSTGKYRLKVGVIRGGLPVFGANVTCGGEPPKRTDLLGHAVFELPYGTYTVSVTVGEETQTKEVLLTQSMTVGFEFQSSPSGSKGFDADLIVVPVLIFGLGFVIFMFMRKR